ncbi:porin [Gemmobacter aquaticus]|uniref:Porin n=1 Tax=Gemmobacter aquaticus TaxID=490185 RepID=A0A917YPK7_9RHOB|nr:porin [Gemmobacter aquaticus]GGO36378.1 porin [Gemmobacter aquaticus]
MKKILLATSILAATTGFAAAEITLSGDARMGVVDYGNDPEFSARARVRFTMAGETDGGLAFGATFRADQATDAKGNEDMSAGTVYVQGEFGKFEMGDVASAAEAAFGDLDGVGYTGLNDYSDITYINGDGGDADSRGSVSLNPVNQGTGSLFSYSNAGFGFYVGLFDGVANGLSSVYEDAGFDASTVDSDMSYSVALSYGTDTWSAGIGYLANGDFTVDGTTPGGAPITADADGAEQIIVAGSGTFGATTVKAYYSDFDNWYFDNSYGLSVTYAADALSFTGYARRDSDVLAALTTDRTDQDSFGLGVAYDLGGGAALKAGIVDSDWEDDTIFDAGITMSF